MEPNKPVRVRLELSDICHSFQPAIGLWSRSKHMVPFHRSQSPEVCPNIFLAKDEDFVFATHSVHRTLNMPSSIQFDVLSEDPLK